MMRALIGFGGLLTVAAVAGPACAQDEVADRATRRLPPSAFAQLPPAVRTEAEKRGCLVPQSAYDPDRGMHNVITGRFRGRNERTWAMLCSRDRVSAILVCNSRPPLRCEELAKSPDLHWLQYVDGDMKFSRVLTTVPAGRARDGVTLAHDAIDDYDAGKASVVWYFESGRWLRLSGAD